MTALANFDAVDETRLEWLAEAIWRNRYLPIPPEELHFVGDGDFLAVGVEFLQWFVRFGGLKPDDRVLDLGCGVGRMALPLTQYVDGGTYDGADVAASGIAWCNENIRSVYGNFRFKHLDLEHPIYNPSGSMRTVDVVLPYADEAFDFVFLTSVLTHLGSDEVRAYAREIRRVLAPKGRCFFTAFMLNEPARDGLRAGKAAIRFDADAEGPEIHADPANPSAAVAFDEDFLLACFLSAGLRRRRPAIYGRWSGRTFPGPTFQDINVLETDRAVSLA
ncbi:MAG TPA: methyltransferase domain-containing protein [Candidatus Cybelea sp.]|nr:methyltransferase domain-containing protein [Candidatus Cybelea sp.]